MRRAACGTDGHGAGKGCYLGARTAPGPERHRPGRRAPFSRDGEARGRTLNAGRLPYHTAIWHALVLAAACHYAVILHLATAAG